MRLTNFGESAWGFSVLAKAEADLLTGIASAADPAGSEQSEHRLYQPPIDDPGEAEESFLGDWEDFVTTGFREEFQAAIGVVEEDLKKIEPLVDDPGEEIEPAEGELFELRIPFEHAESWFSALNQARLVLAGRYGLFDEDGEEAVSLSWEGERPVIAVDSTEENPHSPEERVDAFLRSQAFGFIQEWLVANVLSRGL